MFQRVNTLHELVGWKLGAALTMEREIVEMLDPLIEAAHGDAVKQVLRAHQSETWRHVRDVEGVFGTFGWEVDTCPDPAIAAIGREGKGHVKQADGAVVDSVILAGAMETEHHEIAVYESLLLLAQAVGREDAAEVVAHILDDERRALERMTALARELARTRIHQPA